MISISQRTHFSRKHFSWTGLINVDKATQFSNFGSPIPQDVFFPNFINWPGNGSQTWTFEPGNNLLPEVQMSGEAKLGLRHLVAGIISKNYETNGNTKITYYVVIMLYCCEFFMVLNNNCALHYKCQPKLFQVIPRKLDCH